ncbi:glycosyl hydrolase [Aureococcus anophagefferens]|nr:glycosyl hydrolase [Aureococcus anophagefferens]
MAHRGLVVLAPLLAAATNPLVPHTGMADPHVHVFNGTLYMYSTHDLIEQGASGCCGGDWWIWTAPYPGGPWTNVSSQGLPAWTPESLKETNSLWATDAAEHKGSPPTNIRDPGVLRDDDGRHYIVFGACDGANQPDDACYYAAELHDDMISYEPPRHLSVKGVLGHFGYGKADDKPFLHKRGDLYYLSWGCFYATASEVFGPYQYKGCIIEADLVEEAFMVGNQTAERFSHHIYYDRHSSFVEHLGQWYFYSNDYSHSDAPTGGFRDTVAAFVHYRDDGTIAPVEITAAGVGPRDARAPLPAEQYHRVDGARTTQGGSTTGFVVGDVADGPPSPTASTARASAAASLNLTFANGGECAGAATLAVAGTPLATCALAPTGAWDMYATVACGAALGAAALAAPASADGAVDVAVSFAGCGGAAFAKLDTLTFA